MPTFSVLMANYNDAPTLEAALMPLIEQTVPFERILVIDDGSTDHSLEVLAAIKARAPQIEILRNDRNMGVMATTRRGFEHLTEDYVFPASANDVFSRQIVEHAKAALAVMPDAGLVTGKLGLRYGNAEDQVISLPFPNDSISACTPETYRALARAHPFSPQGGATFVNRQMAIALGGFRDNLKWMSDWFLFAMLSNRKGLVYVPEQFGTMMMREGQFSCGLRDWSKQKPIIRDFFTAMQHEFPKDFEDFRAMALLPSYGWQILPMLLRDATLRQYITPLLLWRLLFFKPARALARLLVPRCAFNALRKWARL